nr:MAG TPA: tape measure protein [Caudoviricetes sp.]
MSRRIADLLIKIGADSYEFQQKMKSVEKGLGGMEKKLSSLGKSLSKSLTVPLTALGAVALSNAETQIQAESRLMTALGGRADVQQRLLSQASEIQSRSVIGDEVIISQQAYLASLGRTEQEIKDMIEASVQLSSATGMSLESAVKNLAKTYGGLTGELGESIPQLKEMTAEQLKNGDAVKFVLNNYKGYAETAANNGLGAMKQLKNAWGDLLEQVGTAMMPFVTKVSRMLGVVVSAMQRISPEAMKIIVTLGGIAAAIGPVSLGISGIIKLMPMLKTGLLALTSPVGLAATAILALGAAFLYAKQQKEALVSEMTSDFEKLSLSTLERQLKENRRLQAVNENESPWQGNSIASKVNYALNKGTRAKNLKMEEEALVAAIEKSKKAIEEREKAEAQAKAITEQMNAAIKGVNLETKKEGGIINDLTNRIEDLEKKKLLPESTREDIAGYNDEIKRLKEKLEQIQNLSLEGLTRKVIEPLEKLPAIKAPALKVDLGGLKPVVSKYQQQMGQIFDAVRNGLYGWADSSSEFLTANVADMTAIVQNYTDTLVAKGYNFESALEQVYTQISKVMQEFDQQVSKFLADSIVAAAEAIGQIITGDLGFGGLMKAILTRFASFLKNIGAQLIEFGTMILIFKSTLKSVLANPWAAIAVGAAMVTAAAIMTSLINKNAQESVPALAGGGLAYGATYAMVRDNPNASVDDVTPKSWTV